MIRERKARTGRNPQTGEAIKIAARKVPAFSAGKGLKDAVGGPKRAATQREKGRLESRRPQEVDEKPPTSGCTTAASSRKRARCFSCPERSVLGLPDRHCVANGEAAVLFICPLVGELMSYLRIPVVTAACIALASCGVQNATVSSAPRVSAQSLTRVSAAEAAPPPVKLIAGTRIYAVDLVLVNYRTCLTDVLRSAVRLGYCGRRYRRYTARRDAQVSRRISCRAQQRTALCAAWRAGSELLCAPASIGNGEGDPHMRHQLLAVIAATALTTGAALSPRSAYAVEIVCSEFSCDGGGGSGPSAQCAGSAQTAGVSGNAVRFDAGPGYTGDTTFTIDLELPGPGQYGLSYYYEISDSSGNVTDHGTLPADDFDVAYDQSASYSHSFYGDIPATVPVGGSVYIGAYGRSSFGGAVDGRGREDHYGCPAF